MPDAPSAAPPRILGDRALPNSLEAERAVLSCILQDPSGNLDLVFGRLKDERFFHHEPHRKLMRCLQAMREDMHPSRIDLVTVQDRLERMGELEAFGGEDYLSQLYTTVPTTANVEQYVETVLDTHILRRLILYGSQVGNRSFEAVSDIPGLIDQVEKELLEITELRTSVQAVRISDLLTDALNHLTSLHKHDVAQMGLRTGFAELDAKITGLKPEELIVIAARPSIGKTTLALNIARNIAWNPNGTGTPVGIFSLEMNKLSLALRFICSEAKINIRDIRDGIISKVRWQMDLMPAMDRLHKMPIIIDDTPNISVLELRQKARRMILDHGVKVFIIDYLQLMRATGGNKTTNREQEVAKLSSEIKSLARSCHVPVVLLAQLNRQAELTTGRPKLSHLRESGAIEQDADIVMILHRERAVDKEEEVDKAPQSANEALECELIIAKHRNGPTGIVKLNFYPGYTLFATPDRVRDSDIPQPGKAAAAAATGGDF